MASLPGTLGKTGKYGDLVAWREDGLGLDDHHVALAEDRDDRRVAGQAQLVHRLPRGRGSIVELHLDDRRAAGLQSQEPNEVTALVRCTAPAPHIARTVWTSLVSRDITSPVG